MRVDPGTFDVRYQGAADPWAFTSSSYELNRYHSTISSLASARYRRCFEPACSIGVLTGRLAARADEVIACDPSPTAVARARRRLSASANVELVTAAIPEWWPPGSFDLIVLSELGYYWDLEGWGAVVERCRRSLRPEGELIAVHWLGSSPDHILAGALVHQELTERFGPSDLHVERRAGQGSVGGAEAFMLDRWTKVPR